MSVNQRRKHWSKKFEIFNRSVSYEGAKKVVYERRIKASKAYKFQTYSYFVVLFACWALFCSEFVQITQKYLMYTTISKLEYGGQTNLSVPAFSLTFDFPVPLAYLYKNVTGNFPTRGRYRNGRIWPTLLIDKYNISETAFYEKKIDLFERLVEEYFGNYSVSDMLQKINLGSWIKAINLTTCMEPRADQLAIDKDLGVNMLGPQKLRSITFASIFGNRARQVCNKIHKRGCIRIAFNNALFNFKSHFFLNVQSPRDVVSYYDLIDVQSEMAYGVVVRRLEVNSLPAPHDTNCHEYSDSDLVVSRSDCISECILAKFVQDGSVKALFTSNSYFYRLSRLKTFSEMNYWNLFEEKNNTAVEAGLRFGDELDRCDERCPIECNRISYLPRFTFRRKEVMDPDNFSTLIQIETDCQYSITIFHSKEHDWYTYLGTVGGLAGMWLGVSALSVWQQASHYAIRLCRALQRR